MIGAQATEPDRTLTLTYAATLHRGDHEVTDLAVLRRCDGALEDDDAPRLQETLVDDASKLVPLERARATLVLEGERLVVRMDLLAVRALEDSDREVLLLLAKQATSGFWGDRVSFAIPGDLLDTDGEDTWHYVLWEWSAREQLPTPLGDGLAHLSRTFQGLDMSPEALATQPDDRLAAWVTELQAYELLLRALVRSPDDFEFGELEKATVVWVAARAELERRRLEQVVAESGVPRVSVDDLDALDDLPPDVF